MMYEGLEPPPRPTAEVVNVSRVPMTAVTLRDHGKLGTIFLTMREVRELHAKLSELLEGEA